MRGLGKIYFGTFHLLDPLLPNDGIFEMVTEKSAHRFEEALLRMPTLIISVAQRWMLMMRGTQHPDTSDQRRSLIGLAGPSPIPKT